MALAVYMRGYIEQKKTCCSGKEKTCIDVIPHGQAAKEMKSTWRHCSAKEEKTKDVLCNAWKRRKKETMCYFQVWGIKVYTRNE